MIPAEYIKTFLPLHELDELTPTTNNSVVPLASDDLFLISQISAYATEDRNAITVSKTINYKNLCNKISSDLAISSSKIDISDLSDGLIALSNETKALSIDLSNDVNLSVNNLIDYANNLSTSISATVSSDYIKKYGVASYDLVISSDDLAIPPQFATKITMSEGKISNDSIEYSYLSDLMTAKQWRIACGGIAADQISTTSVLTVNNDQSAIVFETLSDGYVNCMISAYENDSYVPLQVWIESTKINDVSSNDPISYLYMTLNNPGGFSGKDYYNYYNFSIPLKSNASYISSKVIVKYEDNRNFNPNTKYRFDEYWFYAMPSKDDLSGYVKKANPSATATNVYKLTINSDGLITNHTSVYFGQATSVNAGLVKLGSFTAPKYALELDTNTSCAYVNVPYATSSNVGTIQLTYDSNHTHSNGNIDKFLSCGLETNENHALTFIPEATSSKYGVVKTGNISIDYGNDWLNNKNVISSFVNLNTNGQAYVQIPYANGNDKPGIIKTGIPDTTSLQITRNVYLNDQGIAQVNVANPQDIGLFNDGFTISVEIPLTSSIEISNSNDQVSSFDGTMHDCSAYGDYMFNISSDISGWFIARLMYQGDKISNYSENPYLQIICDNTLATILHPAQLQGIEGKEFVFSTNLGVFKGGQNILQSCRFGAISNSQNIENDKLFILIKEMNRN